MKIKSLLAVCAACAAMCATTVFASAENAPAELPANDLLIAPAPGDVITPDDAKDTTPAAEKNTDTGVEGVAAVVGAVALAGAAVVISRKKA